MAHPSLGKKMDSPNMKTSKPRKNRYVDYINDNAPKKFTANAIFQKFSFNNTHQAVKKALEEAYVENLVSSEIDTSTGQPITYYFANVQR